jgi:hypothetical protein
MDHDAGSDASLERSSSVRVAEGTGKIRREANVASKPGTPIPFFPRRARGR